MRTSDIGRDINRLYSSDGHFGIKAKPVLNTYTYFQPLPRKSCFNSNMAVAWIGPFVVDIIRYVINFQECIPKSVERSIFSHKVGQNWGFCRGIKGMRFKKSTFWVHKVHFFESHTRPPKKTNPG